MASDWSYRAKKCAAVLIVLYADWCSFVISLNDWIMAILTVVLEVTEKSGFHSMIQRCKI
jgi:hypothetical protein